MIIAAYEVVSQTTYVTVTVTFQNVPSSGQSIELNITGEGMDDISESYAVDTTDTTIVVPPGLQRSFEAYSWMTSVALGGKIEKDLLTVDDADVTILFTLYETKIIIPDAENNRIVQIDDMNGTGWTELTWNDLGFANDYEFVPYDMDFDSQGRIYIANKYSSALGESTQILRIDDFNDTTPNSIIEGNLAGATALAIDRENDLIYYGTEWKPAFDSTLFRCNYDGSNNTQFTTNQTYGFPGMAIGENGAVYVVSDDFDAAGFYKYDMNGSLLKGGNYSYLNFAWDVVVKFPYAYVLNTNNYEILQLDINDISQNPLKKYGTRDTDGHPSNPGEFLGPRRFVAILNKKFTVTDEDNLFDLDRLVSLDESLDGSGWELYGQTGSSQGQFRFFYYYGY